MYLAEHTGQITIKGQPISPGCVVHESENGGPLCNRPIRPMKGLEAEYAELGGGIVNCKLCERSHDAGRGGANDPASFAVVGGTF